MDGAVYLGADGEILGDRGVREMFSFDGGRDGGPGDEHGGQESATRCGGEAKREGLAVMDSYVADLFARMSPEGEFVRDALLPIAKCPSPSP